MTDNKIIRTGFIGLGSQGGPMARRMAEAGYPLTLWARRPEALEAFADTAATHAPSIAALGAASDHVGLCVVDDAGVQAVCADLIPTMAAGSRIIIHSTVHPQTCLDLAAQASTRGIALIDAPVSGGGPGATAGTLTVMVGGDANAVADARPVFESFAGSIVHLGGVGAGQLAKLINNALMAAHMALANHALDAGSTLGIDHKPLTELVRVSSGRSYGFEVAARLPDPTAFAHGAKLLAKDVRLLGEVLGDDPDARIFDQLTRPFLDRAQQ
ncbi:NAD(P)-dependent oxidoreductase [Sphingobium aromaticiconvertens]|uniref:NAD(P)-dependent oxidoreductase n=1 Tax=Sphingobium aromaticiconvertens TaxID=365341 RepID=UPI00301A4F9B